MTINLNAKPFNLNDSQVKWVKDTLASMTLDEKIGQLFTFVTYTDDETVLESFVSK